MDRQVCDAFYYAWNPVLESSRDVVSVLLASGKYQQGPLSGKTFAAGVLSAAGLTGSHVSFGCDEFVTCYFNRVTGDSRLWQECWDMRILLPQKTTVRIIKNLVAHPVTEEPSSVGEFRVQIPFRVIADFETRQMRTKCKDSLKERALAQSIRWLDRYDIRDVGPRQHQLCIDIATIERRRLNELFADATTIMTICEEFGGRTFASGPPPA
jgi:hypothetical protein